MSATQKSSSRRRLFWLIPGGLIILGGVVFFAWWQYYKTTPAYTLALVVGAAQQNDRAAFDRVVDLDQVIDNFIAQGAPDSAIGLTTATVTSVRLQLQSLAPEPVAAVKEAVREDVRNRVNELAGSAGARPFLLTALAMPFVSEINQTAERAQVRINRTDDVELVMEHRQGSDWKITSLRDQALARRVVSGIVKRLPQSESEFDKQMRRLPQALPEKLPQLPLP
jgi:hypothetical protein